MAGSTFVFKDGITELENGFYKGNLTFQYGHWSEQNKAEMLIKDSKIIEQNLDVVKCFNKKGFKETRDIHKEETKYYAEYYFLSSECFEKLKKIENWVITDETLKEKGDMISVYFGIKGMDNYFIFDVVKPEYRDIQGCAFSFSTEWSRVISEKAAFFENYFFNKSIYKDNLLNVLNTPS